MTQPDQYDVIGELYERTKALPVCRAETATLMSALPSLAGRSVLDVACGTGYYPRLFKRAGAGRVTGVDSSRVMISYASRVEEHDPLGISYEVSDAATLPRYGEFDVVTAVWLLGYAEGETALDGMLTNLRANLAEGGTFAALVPNPEIDWDGLGILPRYGIAAQRTRDSKGRQGYAVRVEGDPPFEFEGYTWPPGVIESAMKRAGFTGVLRHDPVVPEPSDHPHDTGYWDALFANPTFAVYSAR
ncbi:SAM-dependent methyltransferase [Amycolatopsis antarctica]|uniref:SAM-dependent methyltransferase n=1 Tax=Amycolatopsis antarctica TaxID=1854586 RepID=A0A263D8F3_9PSEU|nr:class I SAM-dependent methyltransferase [Amycolatopsis antarctica]OZM74469.1 SAM-dependent methyltransferase [Amycolatopsis antarctica]